LSKEKIRNITIAIGIGVTCGLLSWIALTYRGFSASDFQFPLEAGRALMEKKNPYKIVVPTGDYPFDQYFYYPIIAAFMSVPFSWLPDTIAGAAFMAISSGFLAYVLAKNNRWRLGIFLSAPAFVTIYTAQWSFVIFSAILIPEIQFFLLSKPNIGLSGFLYKPTIRGVISIAVGIIISLLLFPSWILDWLGTLSHTARYHLPPVFSFLLLFLPFCLFHYKNPKARLLTTLLISPQALFFYDQLLLFLIPKTPLELWIFNLISWIGYLLWRIQLRGLPDTGQYVPSAKPYVLWFLYFPAIIFLLSPKIKKLLMKILKSIKERKGGQPYYIK